MMDTSSQVSDEQLGIGDNMWVSVAELEQDYDNKPFFTAVRKFYVSSIQKMLSKFPFGDALMKNLAILHPNETSSFHSSTVAALAQRFPQLGLSDSETLRCLEEEFNDFTLSPGDLPTQHTYNAADNTEKVCAGPFWFEIGKMKTLSGEPRFSKLYRLMAGLLSIPCLNDDAKWGFSVLRKVRGLVSSWKPLSTYFL